MNLENKLKVENCFAFRGSVSQPIAIDLRLIALTVPMIIPNNGMVADF